jgi:glycosyltransferase involved in cell wall biosynthesis
LPDPLASVIIPLFKSACCLAQAIDSVRTQTQQNTEILVLDDGSTDGTRDLVEQYYAGNPRVRYFFHFIDRPTTSALRSTRFCSCLAKFDCRSREMSPDRYVVKEIRAHLMLDWLETYNGGRIVFLTRHACAVIGYGMQRK